MRLAAQLILVAILGACSKPPAFTFRRISSTTTLVDAVRHGLVGKCYGNVGSSSCELLGKPVAGSYYSKGTVSFKHGRFSYLSVLFSPEQLSDVRDNLIAAYGKPCGRQVGEVATSLGPVASNERIVWCFSDGELVLERAAYGEDENSLIEFPASSRDHATATSANSL